jgi:hypothetical protein
MGRRAGALVLLALLLLLGSLGPVGSAGAQAPLLPQAPSGTMRLRGQTTWWQPEQPFRLDLDIRSSAPEALEVAVGIANRIRTRNAFATTVSDGVSGRPAVEVPPVAVSELPLDADGNRVLTFTPTLRTAGVYPLRVDLRPLGGGAGDQAIASFVTYLVLVPSALEDGELSVAVLLPVHAPPAVQPDGRVAIDDERAERLAELARSLTDQTEVGFTLAPTPETVEALAASPRNEDRQTAAALASALGSRQLLGGPWVPADLTALLGAGLEPEAAGLLTRGTQALRTLFPGTEPTTATRIVDERLDEEALTYLQTQQQVTRLVVPEALLEPLRRNKTLVSTFTIASPRGAVPAVAADTALAAHVDDPDPVLGAQRLLADLAVIYNDDPPVGGRGVVVLPPRAWEPTSAFVDAFLDGLLASPILEGVGIDRFFTDVGAETVGTGSRAAPLVRRIAPPPDGAPVPSLPGGAITEARRRIDSFASIVVVDATNQVGAEVIDRQDRTLLASTSSDLRARERTNYLSGVNGQVQDQLDGITMPSTRSITLTAREGEIPVTVASSLAYPVRAILEVDSDTLEFPDGTAQELALPAHRNATAQFSVRAQSSGSFPVRVRLRAPEGELLLAESRFTVRSTAISGVGTALSIGAGLFLLVWWGNHLRGRRSRRLVPS